MSATPPAEGWYKDPFTIHEARWFSDGRPTALVRDGESESHDPPPEGATGSDVEPQELDPPTGSDGSDLLRADGPPQRSQADYVLGMEGPLPPSS